MKTLEILLVEDNAGDAVLTRQTLAECHLPVRLHIARDGEQALMLLADPDFNPDLIILDLNIPRVSGLSVLQRYERKDIPLVIFSSSWNEIEIERALALGAREFIQKPMDIQSFAAAVCGMVEKWARKDCQSAQGGV